MSELAMFFRSFSVPTVGVFVLVVCSVIPLAGQADERIVEITLADAVDLALDGGRAVRAARAGREATRARVGAFYSRLLPQLSFTGNLPTYNRSIIEVIQPDGSTLFRSQNQTTTSLGARVSQRLPFTGGDLFVESSLARLQVSGSQDFLTWSSTPVIIGLQQPLFRPNALAWDKKEQTVVADVAEREFAEAREGIALETVGLFYDLYGAQVNFETAQTNVAVNDTLFTLNKGRYEIGRIGENDLLQSELALLQSQADLDAAILALARARAALRIALHLSPEMEVIPVVTFDVPQFDVDTTVAVEEALANRAVVRNLDLARIQADRRVTEAKLNNGFGATLSASYGFNATGGDINGAYGDLLDRQQVTVAVNIPLVQWGARRHAVQAAEFDREQTENNSENALEQTAHEARFAALSLEQTRRAVELAAKADTVGAKRFEVAYNRYVIGRIAIDNLFVAQAEKDGAQRQFVQALRSFWTAYYELRRATLYDFEALQRL